MPTKKNAGRRKTVYLGVDSFLHAQDAEVEGKKPHVLILTTGSVAAIKVHTHARTHTRTHTLRTN
jgi:hypothetical protein